ncbi:hypothetical protein J7643_14315 [bacterium]|nr:hypothetical protein [bacterium]
MRTKRILRWEILLALGLVGCTAVAPSRIGPPSTSTAQGPEASAIAPAHHTSSLILRIRWPERQGLATQAIPNATEKIVVTILGPNGAKVHEKTAQRPAAGQLNTPTTLTFDLDPALGSVTLEAVAYGPGNTRLAEGRQANIRLLDNVALGVSITLTDTGALQVVYANQLALVKNLEGYMERFHDFANYERTSEGEAIKGAFDRVLGRRTLGDLLRPYSPPPEDEGGFPMPSEGVPPAGPERLWEVGVEPEFEGSWGVDLLGRSLLALYWQGYTSPDAWANFKGDWQLSRPDPQRWQLDVNGAPDSFGGQYSDQSTFALRARMDAGQWTDTPWGTRFLRGSNDGPFVTRIIDLFGPKTPVFGTMGAFSLDFDLTPNGDAARAYSYRFEADSFRSSASVPVALNTELGGPVDLLWDLLRDPIFSRLTDLSTHLPALPGRVSIVSHYPSLQSTMSMAVRSASTIDLNVAARLKDNAGARVTFPVAMSFSPTYAFEQGKRKLATNKVHFEVADSQQQLKLVGDFEQGPTVMTLHAQIVDTSGRQTNTLLATLDHTWNKHPNGGFDFSRIADFPLLVVNDDPDESKRTRYRLTPGFFNGDKLGHVSVEVR